MFMSKIIFFLRNVKSYWVKMKYVLLFKILINSNLLDFCSLVVSLSRLSCPRSFFCFGSLLSPLSLSYSLLVSPLSHSWFPLSLLPLISPYNISMVNVDTSKQIEEGNLERRRDGEKRKLRLIL